MRAYHRIRNLRARLGPAPDWRGVRILGYHSISERRSTLCVTPAAFRAQMELVAASGLESVALTGTPTSERAICVTFDDGYRDNLEVAVPILRELGIPATVFVVSGVLDGSSTFHWFDDPPPALTWEQARELDADPLFDVQAHTRTHPWLPRIGEDEARAEIAGGKRDLEEGLGRPVAVFCYPAGLYGEREVALVREAGYAAATTTDPGTNDSAADPLRLRRTLVFGGESLDVFRLRLAGRLDRETIFRTIVQRRRAAA